MDEIYGELPNSPVVYAACDSKYFMDHAAPFVYSANDVGKNVHIHVCNPTQEVLTKYGILNSDTDVKFSISFNDLDLNTAGDHQGHVHPEAERTYYACLRFLYLPIILRTSGQVLTLDIDCLVMKGFDYPKLPVGYFPREPLQNTNEWENKGTRVAAGVFYLNSDAQEVADEISKDIEKGPFAWFLDQKVISETMARIAPSFKNVFDNDFMDWEFREGTTVWTGKGSRKFDNPTYVNAKKEFDRYNTAKSRAFDG